MCESHMDEKVSKKCGCQEKILDTKMELVYDDTGEKRWMIF